jgi:hypothetical protein
MRVSPVLVLLLFGARNDDRERTESVHREENADSGARAGQLFDHDAEIGDAAARPAVLLRDPHGQEAFGGQRVLDLPRVFLQLVVLAGEGPNDLLRDVACFFLPLEVFGVVGPGRHGIPFRSRRRRVAETTVSGESRQRKMKRPGR